MEYTTDDMYQAFKAGCRRGYRAAMEGVSEFVTGQSLGVILMSKTEEEQKKELDEIIKKFMKEFQND